MNNYRPPSQPYLTAKTFYQQQSAKKAIRSDMLKIALGLLLLSVLANIYSVIGLLGYVLYFAAHTGLSLQMSQNLAATTHMGTFITGYLPVMLADLTVILLFFKILSFPRRERMFQKPKAPPRFWLFGAIATPGGSALGVLGTLVIMAFFTAFGLEVPGPDFALPEDPSAKTLILLYACLLGPLLEEILFRGFILRRLRRHSPIFAVVMSSILFAMFHMNLLQFCTPVILGIFLSLLTLSTRSIWPAVLGHILNNCLAFAVDFIPETSPFFTLFYFGYLGIGLGIFILFLVLFRKSLFAFLRAKVTPILSLGGQFSAALFGGGFITYLIWYLFNLLALFLIY